MESYHKGKKQLQEKYGKLITLKPINDDDIGIADNQHQNHVKQLQDISDEEGLKRAYDTKDGLYQHYNNLFLLLGQEIPLKTTLTIKNYLLMIL